MSPTNLTSEVDYLARGLMNQGAERAACKGKHLLMSEDRKYVLA
jgi:hypothetical protein